MAAARWATWPARSARPTPRPSSPISPWPIPATSRCFRSSPSRPIRKPGRGSKYAVRTTWLAFAGAGFDVDPLPGSDLQIPILRFLGEGLGRLDFKPVRGTESLCDTAPPLVIFLPGMGPAPCSAVGRRAGATPARGPWPNVQVHGLSGHAGSQQSLRLAGRRRQRRRAGQGRQGPSVAGVGGLRAFAQQHQAGHGELRRKRAPDHRRFEHGGQQLLSVRAP